MHVFAPHQLENTVCERVPVYRMKSRDAMLDAHTDTGLRSEDNRDARGHGFEDHQAESIRMRREHKYIHVGKGFRQWVPVQNSWKLAKPKLLPEPLFLASLANN